MKTLFVLLICVAAVIAFKGFKQDGPRELPPQFIAYVNESGMKEYILLSATIVFSYIFGALLSDLATNWYLRGMKTIYMDTIKKRARETNLNGNGQKRDIYLLYHAPGAEPESVCDRESEFGTNLFFRQPAARGYTSLIVNPDYPKKAPNQCYYVSAEGNASTPFSEVWWSIDRNAMSHEYNILLGYPSNMVYAGVEYISELNVYADVRN